MVGAACALALAQLNVNKNKKIIMLEGSPKRTIDIGKGNFLLQTKNFQPLYPTYFMTNKKVFINHKSTLLDYLLVTLGIKISHF